MTFSDVILNIYRAWSNVHRRCVMTYNFQTGPGSNIIFLQFKFELCMSLSIFFSCLPVCLSGCLSVCLVACLAHSPQINTSPKPCITNFTLRGTQILVVRSRVTQWRPQKREKKKRLRDVEEEMAGGPWSKTPSSSFMKIPSSPNPSSLAPRTSRLLVFLPHLISLAVCCTAANAAMVCPHISKGGLYGTSCYYF